MVKLPDATSIPRVGLTRDPGVSLPRNLRGEGPSGLEVAGLELREIGGQLQEAANRIQARNDATSRVVQSGEYGEFLQTHQQALLDTEDFANPKTVEKYREAAEAKKLEILANHDGTEDSRARLEATLETQKAQAISNALAVSVDQGRKKVNAQIGAQISTVAGRVAQAPETMEDEWANLSESLDQNYGDVLTGPELTAFKRSSAEAMVELSINNLLQQPGGAMEAEMLLRRNPQLQSLMSPQAHSRVAEAIRMTRAEERQRMKPVVLGRDERLVDPATGGTLAEGPRTPPPPRTPTAVEEAMARLRAFTEATGQQPTTAQIAEALDVGGAEGERPFGRGTVGDASNIFASELTPRFAQGLTTEQEDRTYLQAVTNFTQPRQVQNPDTGVMETVRPQIPPFVADALRMRGFDIPASTVTDVTGAPVLTGVTPTPAQQQGAAQPGAEQAEGEAEAEEPDVGLQGKTIYEMAPILTGPGPVIGRKLGGIPGLGGPAPEMRSAKKFVETTQRELVRVLQNNPKYAETERQGIAEEIDLVGQFLLGETAYRQDILGLDQALARREETARRTAESPRVSRDERQHALNVANGLAEFRKNLIPPVVTTVEERNALDVGQTYVAPDGSIAQRGSGTLVEQPDGTVRLEGGAEGEGE